jgi:hypothetical protein
MNYLMKSITVLALLFSTSSLMADSHHRDLLVKGGGTYFSPNRISGGFNVNVTKFNIQAKGNHLVKGKLRVSSLEAAPVDPVTGVNFEANNIIDGARVFATHPDIVWIHGHAETGYITFGTSPDYGKLAGTTTLLNSVNGEVIGAVSPWGRTNFVSVFENNNLPLPSFFDATEAQLIELVGGFSRILLTDGAEPGEVIIKTTKQDANFL